jgi:small subunit ribosomal protein S17
MEKKSFKKTLIGNVVSNKMDKTIVVLVERLKLHPLYKKYVRKSKKFKAHDEKNICKIGDKVKIIECRPLSKDKNYRLLEVLDKAKEELA